MDEVRCPTDNKFVIGVDDAFVGAISTQCARCKGDVRCDRGGVLQSDVRLVCKCRKWVASGLVVEGRAHVQCRRCRVLVALTPDGPVRLELPRSVPPKPKAIRWVPDSQRLPPKPPNLIALIEERWELLRLDRVHRSTDLAVGLRFDVFSRDGFRCRYCGRGPDQGVYLETDHVVARSNGGPDTLANLVTACWDCNRGKSAKVVDTGAVIGR